MLRWTLILLGIPMGLAMLALAIYLLATGEASIKEGLGMSAMGVLFLGAGVNALSPSIVERLWSWHSMRGSRSPFATAEVDELIGLVERGDFAAAEQFLEHHRDAAWHDRAYFVEALAERCKPSVGARWSAARKGAVADLVRGRLLIASAWAARGSGRAESVSDAGWQVFTRDLEQARTHLERAAETDAADPTALAFLIKVEIGTDGEAAERYFQRAIERDPGHHLAHELMLLALCEKWHGSHEEMFELARDAAAAAPAGSSLPMLVVTAHIEHWLYLEHFDGQPAVARAALHADRAEVARAFAASIDHRDYRPDRLTPWRLNEAACWTYLARDHGQLARRMNRLGDVQTQFPWAYAGAGAFRAARRAARAT
ncbi:MAG TPA: hypothetical protein VM261_04445 [Kofleriaceae bacterium]|nr:hypothetical protein [Kofleriaceae bacterium]